MREIEVSIVIPFFSRVDWLMEAVESVLAQTFNNYEIIVVNDGSMEDMTEFLFKYRDKVKYIEIENGGPAIARNEGIKHAKGEYIAFLDSDDLWMPRKLEIQIEEMKRNSAIWSYCGWDTFGVGKKVLHLMTDSPYPIFQKEYKPDIATPSVMVKNELFKEHGDIKFNPALRYGQDSFLWMNIGADYPILAIPDKLVHVRMRGSNASKCARIQLRANSECWILRKENKAKLIDGLNIGFIFKVASELCVCGNYIISKLENAKILSKNTIEVVSKIIYCFPWVLYRIDRITKNVFAKDLCYKTEVY